MTQPACGRVLATQRYFRVVCALLRRNKRLHHSPENFIFASHASHDAARFRCSAQRKLAWRHESHASLARSHAGASEHVTARSEDGLRLRVPARASRFRFQERALQPGRLAGILPRATMQLLVRTLAGRTVAVQADAAERVSAFKARVAGGLTDAVRLTHAGHELDDARTIGELQLGEDAVLQAALRLNGGVMTSVKLVTPRHAAKSITVCCAAQPRARFPAQASPMLTAHTPCCAD